MTYFYLSPHPDDAALSCGGQIAQLAAQGESVVIVTLLAGDPSPEFMALPTESTAYADKLWTRWGLGRGAAATIARRLEDSAAADRLGAQIRFGTFPEAIYRIANGVPLYTDHAGIFGAPSPADPLITLIHPNEPDSPELTELRTLIDLADGDSLIIPLGVGGHVDHQLIRRIGELIASGIGGWYDSRVKQVKIRYYEEYPYSVQHEDAVRRGLTDAGLVDRAVALNTPIDEAALAARIDAVGCFPSQISSFWPNRDQMAISIRDYVDQVGGERTWLIP